MFRRPNYILVYNCRGKYIKARKLRNPVFLALPVFCTCKLFINRLKNFMFLKLHTRMPLHDYRLQITPKHENSDDVNKKFRELLVTHTTPS